MKFAVVAFMVLGALALTDIFLTTRNKPTIRVDSAKLSFESSGTADATLTIQGGLKSNSAFHSMEVTAATCELQHTDDVKSDQWQSIGSIRGTETLTSDNSLSFEFQNTHFASLRRLLYATALNRPLGAAMRCAINVNTHVYHTITVPAVVLIDVQVLAPTPETATVVVTSSALWAGNKLYESVSTTEIDRAGIAFDDIMSVLQSFDAGKALHQQIPNSWHSVMGMFDHSKSRSFLLDSIVENPFFQMISAQSFGSFIVAVPALTVEATAFGDDPDGGRFVLSSSPFELELVQPTLHLKSEIKLQCSVSYVYGESPVTLKNCVLPGPAEMVKYYQKMSSNRLHLSMDIVNHNFITKLAGLHHSFQAETTDVATVNAKLEQRLSAARARTSAAGAASGLVPVSHAATHISMMGAEMSSRTSCTMMDTDGIFTFFICTDETPTSVKFRTYVLDPTDVLVGTTIVSSWAEHGPLNMHTEVLLNAVEGRILTVNNTISEVDGSFRTLLAYEEKGENLLKLDAAVNWHLNSHDDSLQRIGVLAQVNDRVLSGIENLNVDFDLSWKDDKFNAVAHALDLSVDAKGTYTTTDAWNW